MKVLYRIQDENAESMWYNIDGKFVDKIREITGQEIPMSFDYSRIKDKNTKLISSVEDVNMFPNWFSKEQIIALCNNGFRLYEYRVDKCFYYPKDEVLFDLNKIKSVRKIDELLILI